MTSDQVELQWGRQPTASATDSPRIEALTLAYLYGMAYPVLLIDTPDATLLWANEAAEDFLVDGGALVRSSNRIAAADRSLQPAFNAFLNHGAPDGCWLMASADASSAVLVRKAAVDGDEGRGAVMLVVYGPDHRARFMEPDVSPLYGLTPTEGRILQLLCSGQPAERITRSSGTSIETTRTHIRRIYAKMGVSCREELLFAVQQFRVP